MIFEHRLHSHNLIINTHDQQKQRQGQITSYLYSIFETLWPSSSALTEKKRPKGLQPHTAIAIAQVHTVTEPITFDHSYDDNDDDDDYLSKSDSTQSSFGSSLSSISTNSEGSRRRRKSSIALSEILCEHYVHQHAHHDEKKKEVPLETFRMFEASLNSNNNIIDSNDNNKQEEEEESWFMGNTNPKQWVLVDELLRQEKEEQTPPTFEKARGIRTNSAHLRMIVAEVNMMRANKIICPLKPRGFLPSRTDPFIPNTPSPLSISL